MDFQVIVGKRVSQSTCALKLTCGRRNNGCTRIPFANFLNRASDHKGRQNRGQRR